MSRALGGGVTLGNAAAGFVIGNVAAVALAGGRAPLAAQRAG